MAEDQTPDTPQPPPGMPEEEHDDASILEGAGDFTTGEGLVALAGILILAVWLVFDVLINEYGMDNTIAVVGAAAAILPRLNRERVEAYLPLPRAMRLVGWILVAFGVVELILDLRFGGWDAGSLIGALLAYAAYVMAFIGTRQIKD